MICHLERKPPPLAERHAHGTTHARHLQAALEEFSGRNLDQFFRQWIWGAGHPALQVNLSKEDELLVASIQQTQAGDQTAQAFHFRLPLEVVYGDGIGSRVELARVLERPR